MVRFKKKQSLLWVEALFFSNILVSGYVYADSLYLDTVQVASDVIAPMDQHKGSVGGDAAKLLDNEAGMSFYRAGGVSSLPVMRGLADDRIRIKVDGMDLISSCANHMNPPLSYLSPDTVGSIDVFMGISPVSSGGDSIAGTILFHSVAPEFAKSGEDLLTSASVNTFYKSNNNARGINVSASIANEEVYVRYTGSKVEANNYHAGGNFKDKLTAAQRRFLGKGDEIGSTYYESINHALAFAAHRDNHLFEFKLGLQDIPEQGFVNQRMDMTGNDAQQYNFKYEGKYDWGKLEAQVYHEHVRHSMQFGDDKQFFYGNAPGMPMDTVGRTTGLKLIGSAELSEKDLLKVGAEYQRYRLDDYWRASGTGMMMAPNTYLNINNGQRDRYDVFAELESQWNKSWFTQAGLRSSTIKMDTDNVQGYNNMAGGMGYAAAADAFNATDRSKTDHNIDMTALARFTPDDTSNYEAGYAIKTRSPNVYERFAWSNANTMVMNMNNWIGDGNGYVGNLDLKPETAHTISMTAKWNDAANQDWQVKATPYFTYVNNYIDAVSCTEVGKTCPNRTDGFVNLSLDNQSARIAGLDISAKKLLIERGGLGRFTAVGLLSYTRGKNTQTNDDLYNIMPLNAKLGLEHQFGAWKNQLEVKLVASKDHVQGVRKEIETTGFSLFNFYTSYDWKKVRLDLSVENIFDKLYADPLGGAYLGQGATMGTGVASGVQVPGVGRSVNVGLTLFY